jgi:hypothetical protein
MIRRSSLNTSAARFLLFAGMIAVSGCSGGTIACPAILTSALLVRVKDARTGAFIATGTTLTARFGTVQFTDDIIYPSGAGADSLPIAVLGSSGTYGILIQRRGYFDYSQNGIAVPDDHGCGAKAVRMTVNLLPNP